jgi:hypothetical protein
VREQALLDEVDSGEEFILAGRIPLGDRIHDISRYQVPDKAVRSVVAPGVGHLVEVVRGKN